MTENNINNDIPTTSASIKEKPIKSKEKDKIRERPLKRKSNEEKDLKKKEKEIKKKKKRVNIKVDDNVTIRKKRRKLTDVLQQEAREQVFGGSNDADRFFLFLNCSYF